MFEVFQRNLAEPQQKRGRPRRLLVHGRPSTYAYGRCRCEACTKANTDYQREWRRKRAEQ